MINRLLQNLTIKYKLYLITLIAIANLLMIAWGVSYFFGTFQVLNILTNAERIHMSYFQQGVIDFYRYQYKPENINPQKAINQVVYANQMAFTFGKIDSIAKANSTDDYYAVLLQELNEVLDNKPENARLLGSRSKLFLAIGDKRFKHATETAFRGYITGVEVVKAMEAYTKNPSAENEDYLQQKLAEIQVEYDAFAVALHDLGSYGQKLLFVLMLLLILLSGVVVVMLSLRISRAITKPIQSLVGNFETMSRGALVEQLHSDAKDETASLIKSFNLLQESLASIVSHAKKVADGHYEAVIKPKSEKDELAISLNRMTTALAENESQQKKLDWLKTGKSKLGEEIQGDKALKELSDRTLTFLANYLDAQLGTLYIFEKESGQLVLQSKYGLEKAQAKEHLSPGETLVGQVFVDNKIMHLDKLAPDRTFISGGLIRTAANALLIFPLVHNKQVFGVVELASYKAFGKYAIDLVNDVSESIAISINSAISRLKMSELLATTQQQSEELQTQQEELRVSNEELEEQAVALKENEKKLQEQQEELRVTNEELEERTHDLELQRKAITEKNTDLEKARLALEEKASQLELTSRYKSEFLANMSHELRTPLNSLLILSRDLAENRAKNLTNEQIESANIINASGYDLLNLINEILDLSKIESGKMTITPEPVRLEDIAYQARNNFKHMAEEKGLDFHIDIEKGLPKSIITDKHRLDQIIKNLVSNALKFTPQGSVSILFSQPSANFEFKNDFLNASNSLLIAVQDTGIGVPQKKLMEIFEAFQQADGSISRKYGGTGLGLSITRELCRLLGGEIHLESTEGKGSTFTIVLPLKLDKTPDEQPEDENMLYEQTQNTAAAALPSKPKEVSTDLDQEDEIVFIPDDRESIAAGDKTMLIVEDDLKFAKTLKKQCFERGFKCLVSGTGEHALLMAEKYKPNAIILDLKLPGMSGYKVLEAIKQNPSTRHIPVHIMSALDENIEAFQKGAIGFISKPVDADKLDAAFKKIESYVEKNIKDLLVIEDDNNMRSLIKKLIGGEDVKVTEAKTGTAAINILREQQFDCVVLDLGLPDMTGFELLQKLGKIKLDFLPPIIVYTGRELTKEENFELQKYTSSIIIKGVKSEERLLDETALFLHRVVDNMPDNKQQLIANLHDKEAVLRNKKILLVDDDMRNVFALTRILEDRGMKVVEAENGLVAIERLKENEDIDLVLMDIMMPEMDGYTATKEIRKNNAWSKLPIITLTAKAMKEDREKSIQAGANDYLAKPVDVNKLISLLRVWLYK
jgi:CheY-like chemotaxis protein/signal transduction histidine kinase